MDTIVPKKNEPDEEQMAWHNKAQFDITKRSEERRSDDSNLANLQDDHITHEHVKNWENENNDGSGSHDEDGTKGPKDPNIFAVPTQQNYHSSGFVHCCIIRDVENSPSRFHQRYNFIFQNGATYAQMNRYSLGTTEITSMIAEKQPMNRASNYHIFDTSRGGSTTKLAKKAGHYIGKLRQDKDGRSGRYSLYNARENKEQVAAFGFNVPSFTQQFLEGQPPRKLVVVILPTPVEGSRSGDDSAFTSTTLQRNRMIECLEGGAMSKKYGMEVLHTREPNFDGGQYRLNFSGRVSVPSVKNMQVEMDDGSLVAQFGRVTENKFHLDYRAPLNAFQAFAMAITQFDL
mmetsp:Transcript_28971/g.42703  ORF Transcript_28971/g.42703 Transcript_28971/m.42703 type:complete len:345 (+) Transcript_28971:172-1206(+)